MKKIDLITYSPVSEALFDIQVELPQEITFADLENLSNDIKAQYPNMKARQRFGGSFELKEGHVAKTESIDLGIDGFLNWSSDEKQVVQFRLDGFSFSRLRPYNRWEEYFPEVMKNWNLYAKKLKPIRIKRVAVRYINTIEIPFKGFELKNYFVNFPKSPLKTSTLESFFNRVEFSLPDSKIKAVITQNLVQSNNPVSSPVIIDIEVSSEVNLQLDEKAVIEVFKILRIYKNDIFEKSLRPKAKELFK